MKARELCIITDAGNSMYHVGDIVPTEDAYITEYYDGLVFEAVNLADEYPELDQDFIDSPY